MRHHTRAVLAIISTMIFAVPLVSFAAVVYAPTPPQPSGSSDVVGLVLQNTTSSTEAAGYVTFGHVFKQGSVRPTDSLVARIGGTNYPVQMDVKATHSDGSVRHAVITLRAPSIAAGSSVSVMLAKGSAASPSPAAPSVSALLATGYDVTTTLTFRSPNTNVVSASAATTLKNTASPKQWLSGPLVNEWRVETTVNNSLLKVTFDIRAYADGTVHTDVIHGTDWFFSPGKSDLNYDVSIKQGGTQVYSYSNIYQYLYSKWHKEIDNGNPTPNVQFDVPYLVKTGAIQNYDLSYGATDSVIAANVNELSKALPIYANPTIQTRYGPMGTALVTVTMPSTGGRGDIGPQTAQTSQWIVSQDASARKVMMANADASGAVPWQFTDENTGDPISRATYPTFLLYYIESSFSPQPANGWPKMNVSTDPWIPDAAHMPDFNYVPYMITGSHYQLDLFKQQANYAITWSNPYYEYYDISGVVNPTLPNNFVPTGVANGQARSIAWGLRQVAEAAYLVPDKEPMKPYLNTKLTTTMNGLVKHYITDDAMKGYGAIKGFILGSEYYLGVPLIATWQQGYIATTFTGLASMGMPQVSDQAKQLLGFMSNFMAGLYTNGANGFNPYNGPGYNFYMADPATKASYTTWADLQAGNIKNAATYGAYGIASANTTTFGNSAMDTTAGIPVINRAALAGIVGNTRLTQAQQAYDFVVTEINTVWQKSGGNQTAAWQGTPSWLINPAQTVTAPPIVYTPPSPTPVPTPEPAPTPTPTPAPAPTTPLISNVSITGPFTQTNTCDKVLAIGENCTFTILFNPPGAGTFTGVLTFTDTSDGSVHTVPLSGSARETASTPTTTPPASPPSPSPGASSALTQGLVGYWNFDGAITDTGTGGMIGTAMGSPAFSSGQIGQAITLNGTNQYVYLAGGYSSSVPPTGPSTFAAWIKPNTTTGMQAVVGQISHWTTGYGYGLLISAGSIVGIAASNDAGWVTTLKAPVSAGVWSHVVFTLDKWGAGATGRLYVNGTLAASYTGTAAKYAYDYAIGAGGQPGSYSSFFNGALDDVRVYNRALSASEVQELYQAGQSGTVARSLSPQVAGAATSALRLLLEQLITKLEAAIALLSGESQAAAVSISSQSLSFGSIDVGQNASNTLTITLQAESSSAGDAESSSSSSSDSSSASSQSSSDGADSGVDTSSSGGSTRSGSTAGSTQDSTIQSLLAQIETLKQKLISLLAARGQSLAASLKFTRNLYRGITGSDVVTFQNYLIQNSYLAPGNNTGLYGPLTEAAVQKLQCTRGIVCSGNAKTTGWGVVGPKTRGVMGW